MKKACSYCGKMMQDVEVPKIGATPFSSCNISKVTLLDKRVFPRRALHTLKVLSPLSCLSSKCRRAELSMCLMTTLLYFGGRGRCSTNWVYHTFRKLPFVKKWQLFSFIRTGLYQLFLSLLCFLRQKKAKTSLKVHESSLGRYL